MTSDEMTGEMLRKDAKWYRVLADRCIGEKIQRHHRAAAALEEQAARMEQGHAELRGWGVMRPDGTLHGHIVLEQESAGHLARFYGPDFRSVPVRLTTEGATPTPTPTPHTEG